MAAELSSIKSPESADTSFASAEGDKAVVESTAVGTCSAAPQHSQRADVDEVDGPVSRLLGN